MALQVEAPLLTIQTTRAGPVEGSKCTVDRGVPDPVAQAPEVIGRVPVGCQLRSARDHRTSFSHTDAPASWKLELQYTIRRPARAGARRSVNRVAAFVM